MGRKIEVMTGGPHPGFRGQARGPTGGATLGVNLHFVRLHVPTYCFSRGLSTEPGPEAPRPPSRPDRMGGFANAKTCPSEARYATGFNDLSVRSVDEVARMRLSSSA
ncbi:hypothetical protein VTK73DRAFT_2274 [Phialemonium thermophilum]|uniref:Uncharacterized protein n=1 Tax=Phialemonium thermophilum TaxID=223376 RepID=A0ABR3VSE9_9PEZI